MKTLFSALIGMVLMLPLAGLAQNRTSVVRGTIIDKDTRQPLTGVTVMIKELQLGTNTNEKGEFRLNVPVGRHVIEAKIFAYLPYVSEPVNANSAKETVLEIEMVEEGFEIEGLTIVAPTDNPDAPVSINKLDVEHSEYKPGAISDPSRMIMAEAGVIQAQDNNSDVIIRGNSPAGLLWRLEGIDIPNPNHFARKGSSGGGITIFSAQVLGESSFSTGAFSADYGNALAGTFDMKFRKGNRENREYRFKAGLLGLDFATEGPIKAGRSSYLINYRYSTLGILNQLGFRLTNERVGNNFQDLSFNFYIPTKNDKGIITIFGIGGKSEEIADPVDDSLFYSRDYRTTTDFLTDMGAVGITYTQLLENDAYLKWVVAAAGNHVIDNDDTLNISNVPFAMPNDPEIWKGLSSDSLDREDYRDGRISTHLFYNKKINESVNFRAGAIASHLMFSFENRRLVGNEFKTANTGKGSTQLLQGYTRLRWQPNTRFTLNAGLHGMYLALNKTYSFEPRLSMSYFASSSDKVSLAYGLHSQVLPLGSYFTQSDGGMPNQNLEMTKAHHAVLAYEHAFNPAFRLRAEAYYQYLFDLPIVDDPTRSYMLLNERDGYADEALVSEGVGRNYGIDVSVKQAFAKGSFLLFAGSLYESQYMTQIPDTWFDTRYNGNYSFSLMGGKEWYFGENQQSSLQVSGRAMYNGALRYSPIDLEATRNADPLTLAADEYIPIDALAFTEKVGDYYRLDLRVAFRINGEKVAHLISLDVQNATNRLNKREPRFDVTQGLVFREQSGLIPVIAYQIDF